MTKNLEQEYKKYCKECEKYKTHPLSFKGFELSRNYKTNKL